MRHKFFKWLVGKATNNETKILIALWDGIFDLGLYGLAVIEFKREVTAILKSIGGSNNGR